MADDKPPFKKFDKNGPNLQDGGKEKKDDSLTPPPHAVGAEKSLLSSMLQNPEEYIGLAIEGQLTSAHFYVPSHGCLLYTSDAADE